MEKNKSLIIVLIMLCTAIGVGCGKSKETIINKNTKNDESISRKIEEIKESDISKGETKVEGSKAKVDKNKAIKAIKLYMNKDFDQSKYEYNVEKRRQESVRKSKNVVEDYHGDGAFFREKGKKNGYFISFGKNNTNVICMSIMGNIKGKRKKYSKSDLQNIALKTFKKIKSFSNAEYKISENKVGTDYMSLGFLFTADGKEIYINIDRKIGRVNSLGIFSKDKSLIEE